MLEVEAPGISSSDPKRLPSLSSLSSRFTHQLYKAVFKEGKLRQRYQKHSKPSLCGTLKPKLTLCNQMNSVI